MGLRHPARTQGRKSNSAVREPIAGIAVAVLVPMTQVQGKQHVQLSTRYGLVGIGGLALLTFVQWAREQRPHLEPVGEYLLGVVPNFAAAIAICFVLLGIWTDQARNTTAASNGNRFLASAAISGLGLAGWEFVQQTSQRFVFDPGDLLATFAGMITSAALFYAITPAGR